MKKFLAAFVVVLGCAGVSHAGVLVEPYLGYEMGKTDPSGKLEGTQMGLRLAYKAPVFFWAGLDATLGVSAKLKPDGSSDSDAKRTTLYGVVGVEFPVLLRAWAGYGFSDELKVDSGKYKGKATKFGVGFTGLPFVSLNLEYINEKFDDFDGLSADTKNDTYVLSVSLPFFF